MLQNIKEFVFAHTDFKVYSVTWIAVLNALLILPCIWYLPEKFGYENGLLENIQLITLLIGFIFCVKDKNNSTSAENSYVKFFRFCALVLVILFLREINCGRTIFFPVPGQVNAFYGWKDIQYGWLAHPIYGLYMAYVAFYFFFNRIFITLWNIIKNVKFPVWNILLMITGMIWGTLAERTFHNMVMEEITELLFYTSLVGIIYLYGFNKNFQLK